MSRKISQAGLDLIKHFEGLKLKAYLCPAGVPTIGYGSTKGVTHEDVKNGKTVTKEQADQMLMKELTEFEVGVQKLVKVDLTEAQFSALVSFAYNLGLGNLGKSTLLKKLNAKDYAGAAEEFIRWNKAAGKVLKGLTLRRQAEKDMFLSEPKDKVLPDGPAEKEIKQKLVKSEQG